MSESIDTRSVYRSRERERDRVGKHTGRLPHLLSQLAFAVVVYDLHALEQLGILWFSPRLIKELLERGVVFDTQSVLERKSAIGRSAIQTSGHRGKDILYKVVPLHDVFRYVLDGVFEKESIPVTEWFLVSIVESYPVDRVAKVKLVRVLWQLSKSRPLSCLSAISIGECTSTGNSQEKPGIRNGADETTARAEVA
jgi:hypothetical protein